MKEHESTATLVVVLFALFAFVAVLAIHFGPVLAQAFTLPLAR